MRWVFCTDTEIEIELEIDSLQSLRNNPEIVRLMLPITAASSPLIRFYFKNTSNI